MIKKQLPPDGVVKRERRTDKKVAELMPKITANEFEMRAKRITYAQKTVFGARMRGAFPSFFSLSQVFAPFEIKDKQTQQLWVRFISPRHSECVCGCKQWCFFC